MPELPDVETFRRYFDATALHQKITGVKADAKVLDGVSENKLADALKGRQFAGTKRHGKHLFAEINEGGWLAFHFGMTGFLKYFQKDEEKPGHVRMLVNFENGYHLAFDCQRKFGRIRLSRDLEAFLQNMELGPDAFSEAMTAEAFAERLSNSRGYVKSVLMNQAVIAGIGNVYADEILYHARIHPKRKTDALSASDMKSLYRAMRDVLERAIAAHAEPDDMPENFLLTVRGTDADCPCGGKLEKIKVSGRNGYYCPTCQK